MPKPNTRQKEGTFDLATIMHGVGDGVYIRVEGNTLESSGVSDGDLLLVDRARDLTRLTKR